MWWTNRYGAEQSHCFLLTLYIKLPFFSKAEAEKQRALDELQEKHDQTMCVLEESQKITSKTQKQFTDETAHINLLSGEQKC